MDDVFIGRQAELAEITAAISTHRLVTIVGAPGVGKTRLATEVTAQLGAGFETVTVDLTPASTPDGVARAVAGSLGVADTASPTAIEAAASLIRARRVLLAIDNCERVVGAVVDVVRVLSDRCPNLAILATSRQPLHAEEEFLVVLEPLIATDAVALFAARAGKSFVLESTNTEAVTDICRRLDDLPLAIELAAARTDVLAATQLNALINERLSATVADPSKPEARHRSLDAAIAWSWDLLSAPEQALLRRLSVFSAGATAASVRAVCTGTEVVTDEVDHHLGRLVDHCLVVADGGRYRLLETLRHFARQRLLRAGESAEARDRHAQWVISLAEEAERHLTGSRQREWIQRLDAEADNVRAALEWLVTDHQSKRALHLASALTLWRCATSALTEGRKWFVAALAEADDEPTLLRGKALFGVALLADIQGDTRMAMACSAESLQIGRRLGDIDLCARSLLVVASCMLPKEVPGDAVEAATECVALAREAGDAWCLSYGLTRLGVATRDRTSLEAAVAVAHASGDSIAVANGLISLANWFSSRVGAKDLLGEALSVTAGIRCLERTAALIGAGRLALDDQDWVLAKRYLDSAREAAWRTDSIVAVSAASHELARLAHASGELAEARDLLEQALELERQTGAWSIAIWLSLAQVVAAQGDTAIATDLIEPVEKHARDYGFEADLGRILLVRADISRREDRFVPAADALTEALSIFESDGELRGIADCLESVGSLAIARESVVHGVTLFAAAVGLRAGRGFSQFPPDHPHYDADIAAARACLTVEEFESAWAGGEGLSAQEAVAAARRPLWLSNRDDDEAWGRLTDDELAVVELVADGLTNREISERLVIAPSTVPNRLHRARIKLGFLTRSALVSEARRRKR